MRAPFLSLVARSAFLLFVGFAISCGGKGPTTPSATSTTTSIPGVASVSISGSTSFTAPGQASQLSAIATLTNGTTENVTAVAVWQTSNPAVAVVSGSGLLTAQGVGTTQVTAVHQNVRGMADVNVIGPPAQPCTVSLSETAVTFGRGGGSRTVNVQTSASSCTWQATTNDNWLRITSGSSGSGNGVVSYNVDALSGSVTREGTIAIGGQTLRVRQTPDGCGYPFCYTVEPAEQIVSSAGGNFSFIAIGTSDSGGPGTWEVYSNPPWLTVTGGRTATGRGTVTYSVQPNTSALDRVGEIVVGGISRQFPPAVHRVVQRGR